MLTTNRKELLNHLSKARSVVALTGAGVSQESGIPTFREAQSGLWAQFKPEELATPQAFSKDPARVWKWYEYRRGLIRKSRPNQAHHALASMETLFNSFWLITQNIDGLHALAGSKRRLELHGNIFRNKCFKEETLVEDYLPGEPPLCPRCGSYVRPDVVWFNEPLPQEVLNRAMELASHCQAFLVVGTSSVVYPAAHLPFLAKRSGACIIEINTNPTPVTEYADFTLLGKAGELLPEIAGLLVGMKG
jgi:NAD-dependent deacetylase